MLAKRRLSFELVPRHNVAISNIKNPASRSANRGKEKLQDHLRNKRAKIKSTERKKISVFSTILQLFKTGPNTVFQRLPAVVRDSSQSTSTDHKTSLCVNLPGTCSSKRDREWGKSVPMT